MDNPEDHEEDYSDSLGHGWEDSEETEDDDLPLPEFDADGNLTTSPSTPAEPLVMTDEEFRDFAERGSIEENAASYDLHAAIRDMICTIGDDPDRPGLIDTPDRVIRSWNELYAGYWTNVKDLFTEFDNEGYDEMVILRGIEFFSMCEHHILPFHGKAHVAYIPGDKIVGLSKLARLVDVLSKRLQNQERLTQQIVEALMEHLSPRGAACVMEGHHMCMACRGVKKPHSTMVTSCFKGAFQNQATRAELFSLIKG